MPTLEDLIDSPKNVAFTSKASNKQLRVTKQGKVNSSGAWGKLVWFDVSGDADNLTIINVQNGQEMGICGNGLGLNPQERLHLHQTGDGSVVLTDASGTRGVFIKDNKAAKAILRPINLANPANAFRFVPVLQGKGVFPLRAEAPTLDDGTIFRLNRTDGPNYVNFSPKGLSGSGGNGPRPWCKVVMQDGGLFILHVSSRKFVSFKDGVVSLSARGTPVCLEDAGSGTVKLVSSDGAWSVVVLPRTYEVVPADDPRASRLVVVVTNKIPSNIQQLAKHAGKPSRAQKRRQQRLRHAANPAQSVEIEPSSDEDESARFLDEMDDLLSDSEDDADDAQVFEEIIALPKDERRERLMGLPAAKRAAFKVFAKHKAQEKLERKLLRRQKRQVIKGEADPEGVAAVQAQHHRIVDEDSEAAVDAVLAMEESEDDVDDEEFERQQEEAARLNAEMQAKMKAEMEEMQRKMEEQRQAVIAERERIRQEQEAMKKQMEEELARMAAEAAQAEAEESPAEEEDDDDEEEEEEEEDAGNADDAKEEEVNTEDAAILNENTIEREVNLPKPSGTVHENPDFDAEASARKLKEAFKGWGCNKDKVTEVVISCNNAQRHSLVPLYKTMYGKDLVRVIDGEVTRKTGRVVKQMMKRPADYDAYSIKKACKGLGTTDSTLIEIIATRSNKQILDVCASYKTLYKKDLEDVINGETSGNFRRLLISLLQGGRDEGTTVDEALAAREAELLQKSTEGWSTDKSSLNQVLALRNAAQLRATFNKYLELSGKDITYTLKKRLPSHLAQGMITIVQCCRNPARYFAEKIYRACKGFGTADETLMRVILSRCEIDMVQIKEIYPSIAGVALAHTLKKETSGHYRTILLALIGEPEK